MLGDRRSGDVLEKDVLWLVQIHGGRLCHDSRPDRQRGLAGRFTISGYGVGLVWLATFEVCRPIPAFEAHEEVLLYGHTAQRANCIGGVHRARRQQPTAYSIQAALLLVHFIG